MSSRGIDSSLTASVPVTGRSPRTMSIDRAVVKFSGDKYVDKYLAVECGGDAI